MSHVFSRFLTFFLFSSPFKRFFKRFLLLFERFYIYALMLLDGRREGHPALRNMLQLL